MSDLEHRMTLRLRAATCHVQATVLLAASSVTSVLGADSTARFSSFALFLVGLAGFGLGWSIGRDVRAAERETVTR